MRLNPSQERKIILALAEIESGNTIAHRRLQLYGWSSFALGVVLLGFAVFEAVNEPSVISAALTGVGAGTALATGLHFCLALTKRPIVQRYLDREKIYRSLREQ